ncbi:Na+/phosphate symporter [Gottschalkia purinilytica]|uniref:Na+/phosphate symporter n=1 Tax=Gottschalkia purinilytica TaxID=1503 RepID=A0A0L0W6L8_GOTPU|nr:sigma factor-like helix-turn-helix DNA-binding protein [Gottschalkia purinilytica]KNF07153.1 Na+/phosphate symporter [Gottschalkia purinilytica]
MERTERMIRGYYRNKKRLNTSLQKLEVQKERIEQIRRDIKECNISLDTTISSIDYSVDRVQGSTVISAIERELERNIDMLIRELERAIRYKITLEYRIKRKEEQLMNLEVILRGLDQEERKLLELLYKDKKTYRQIEHELHMTRSTISRRKKEILTSLAEIL